MSGVTKAASAGWKFDASATVPPPLVRHGREVYEGLFAQVVYPYNSADVIGSTFVVMRGNADVFRLMAARGQVVVGAFVVQPLRAFTKRGSIYNSRRELLMPYFSFFCHGKHFLVFRKVFLGFTSQLTVL